MALPRRSMTNSRSVYVEKDELGPVRIFKLVRDVYKPGVRFPLDKMPYAEAVEAIRRRVFDKAEYQCEKCGTLLTWKSGHMHEKVFRGHGGEISIWNSICLCYDCHVGDNPYSEHGNRRPQFSKSGPHDR